MNELVAKINVSSDLAAVEVRDDGGTVFPGASPVVGTPGAIVTGATIASATVTAYEAGQG